MLVLKRERAVPPPRIDTIDPEPFIVRGYMLSDDEGCASIDAARIAALIAHLAADHHLAVARPAAVTATPMTASQASVFPFGTHVIDRDVAAALRNAVFGHAHLHDLQDSP